MDDNFEHVRKSFETEPKSSPMGLFRELPGRRKIDVYSQIHDSFCMFLLLRVTWDRGEPGELGHYFDFNFELLSFGWFWVDISKTITVSNFIFGNAK